MTTEGHRRGRAAEDAACAHLQDAGLRLVARNVRMRCGEIDLIMRDGDSLVFVEVRSRRSRAHGGALESIDRRKQQRMIRAARAWIAGHPREAARPMRFDVLAYEGEDEPRWVRNAIDCPT